MGLSMSSLEGSIPVDARIGSIIVHCLGGGCLAEEANLSKFDPRVIYTCDRMIGANELISWFTVILEEYSVMLVNITL